MALTDTLVRTVKPNGKATKHADGNGMYLLVTPTGKYWRLDYRYLGKRKTLALGTYPETSLAKARTRSSEARTVLADGLDPGDEKRKAKLAQLAKAAQTFEQVAALWLEKTASSRAATTQEKVHGYLKRNIFPTVGSVPISSLKATDVLACLRKMEARGVGESTHRVKQICGQVFRFAVASGMIERDVTVDLKGALKVIKTKHYAAITDPRDARHLMNAIYAYRGNPYAVAALKLSALLFVRPGELRSAEWAHVDFDAAEWRIPAEKMKMRMDHIVPLARQALIILADLKPMTGHGKYILPSIRTDERCMSENTVNAALRHMGYGDDVMTAHGFRAMARTILDEVLGERVDLIEHQLAHAVIDPNGRAYNRTAHLPARRAMMQRWADYLDQLRLTNLAN
jgi:integrase